ncbi:HMG (high mobility group) box domain-containing protein [Ditylenchus destructor]|nr:HMG (high mobility group) box domain-containing protein [Ditylenchus destructor]
MPKEFVFGPSLLFEVHFHGRVHLFRLPVSVIATNGESLFYMTMSNILGPSWWQKYYVEYTRLSDQLKVTLCGSTAELLEVFEEHLRSGTRSFQLNVTEKFHLTESSAFTKVKQELSHEDEIVYIGAFQASQNQLNQAGVSGILGQSPVPQLHSGANSCLMTPAAESEVDSSEAQCLNLAKNETTVLPAITLNRPQVSLRLPVKRGAPTSQAPAEAPKRGPFLKEDGTPRKCPRPAFRHWRQANVSRLSDEYPHMSTYQFNHFLREMWDKLPEAEKKPFERMEQEERRIYRMIQNNPNADHHQFAKHSKPNEPSFH